MLNELGLSKIQDKTIFVKILYWIGIENFWKLIYINLVLVFSGILSVFYLNFINNFYF